VFDLLEVGILWANINRDIKLKALELFREYIKQIEEETKKVMKKTTIM
jgi:hypothetical protein